MLRVVLLFALSAGVALTKRDHDTTRARFYVHPAVEVLHGLPAEYEEDGARGAGVGKQPCQLDGLWYEHGAYSCIPRLPDHGIIVCADAHWRLAAHCLGDHPKCVDACAKTSGDSCRVQGVACVCAEC